MNYEVKNLGVINIWMTQSGDYMQFLDGEVGRIKKRSEGRPFGHSKGLRQ